MADRTYPTDYTGQEVDIKLGGNRMGGGRVLDDGGVHKAAPEHGRTVYRYTITVRPI